MPIVAARLHPQSSESGWGPLVKKTNKSERKLAKPGDRLPIAPCQLDDCPVGSAVHVDGEWWILTFRIGTHGDCHLRAIPSPDDPDWSTVPLIKAVMMSPNNWANDVRWPKRSYVRSNAVVDPVAGMELGDSSDAKD